MFTSEADQHHQEIKCKCEGLETVEAYGPPLFSSQALVFATGPRPPTMYKYTVHKFKNDTKFRKNASSSFITFQHKNDHQMKSRCDKLSSKRAERFASRSTLRFCGSASTLKSPKIAFRSEILDVGTITGRILGPMNMHSR